MLVFPAHGGRTWLASMASDCGGMAEAGPSEDVLRDVATHYASVVNLLRTLANCVTCKPRGDIVPGDHCDKLAHYMALRILKQGRGVRGWLAFAKFLCMTDRGAIVNAIDAAASSTDNR